MRTQKFTWAAEAPLNQHPDMAYTCAWAVAVMPTLSPSIITIAAVSSEKAMAKNGQIAAATAAPITPVKREDSDVIPFRFEPR
jgi:predicted lipoprotein